MAPTRRTVLGGLTVALAGLAGCIGDDDDPGATPTPDDGPPAEDPDPAATVGAFDVTFEPEVVTIAVGETVEWTHEAGSHTVTLFHADNDVDQRSPEAAEAFDYTISSGTVSHTFETEGVHDYFCRPHAGMGMAGTVVVGEPDPDEPGLRPPSEDLHGAMQDRIEGLNQAVKDEFGLDDEVDAVDAATVEVATVGDHEILVDGDGMTLYMFDADEQGADESACYDDCVAAWPPLVDDAPIAGDGVTADLTTFEREDDDVQVSANGWPLYYFVDDADPGDANGQGVNDVWWVLDPAGEPIRNGLDGDDATPTPTPDDDEDDSPGPY